MVVIIKIADFTLEKMCLNYFSHFSYNKIVPRSFSVSAITLFPPSYPLKPKVFSYLSDTIFFQNVNIIAYFKM